MPSLKRSSWIFLALAASFPGSALAQVIDFESIPSVSGSPANNTPIGDDYMSLGVVFDTVIPNTTTFFREPRIATQSASGAFAGCGGNNRVAPGQGVGETYLTYQGTVLQESLRITYLTPVDAASGVLIDVDARANGDVEQWTIFARDASGTVIDEFVLTAPIGPTTPGCAFGSGVGPGHATALPWSIAAAGIRTLTFEYTGTASGAGVGIGFDNFSVVGGPYPGTTEDLVLETRVNDLGSGIVPVKSAMAGDTLTVTVRSPAGLFVGSVPAVFASVFPTGAFPGPSSVPGIQVELGVGTIVLFDGFRFAGPFGPLLLPPGGTSFQLEVPAGISMGTSVLFQGLGFDLSAANGVFAATDAHEVQF